MLRNAEYYLFDAIAYELCGKSLEDSDEPASKQYTRIAISKFEEYGADVKCNLLKETCWAPTPDDSSSAFFLIEKSSNDCYRTVLSVDMLAVG